MVKMNRDQSLDSNNEESFVVLERCTEENSSTNGHSHTNFANSDSFVLPSVIQNLSQENFASHSLTINSASASQMPSMESVLSMNYEEVQKRLQDLIKENTDLKVTLQQHNLAMKQQFQTLKMWQDEVYKVHQNHREKFEETKQHINKITAENKELKKALSERSQGDVQTVNEANAKLLAENTSLQKQVNILQEKLSNAVQREKKYLQPSIKEAELNSVIEQLTRQLEVAERARRQLSMDVERLTAQHSRMHPPLGAPIAMLEESSTNEKVQPAEQLKRYNEWLQHLEKMEEDINRASSLSSWMPIDAGNVTFEVHELRKLLTREQKLSASRKESIGEVRQCFQRLLSDYQMLYHDWEWFKQEYALIKERDDVYEQVQRSGYQERLDNLTAQLMTCKEGIKEKASCIDAMKDKIDKLQTENESIDVLKAQVNLYQSDFEAERKCREELVDNKEKLAEDLRHLQRRNEQLLEELKEFQDERFRQIERRSATHSPSPSQNALAVVNQSTPSRQQSQSPTQQALPSPSPSPPQKFTCPNPTCNREFDLIQPLERHVFDCLKLQD